MFVDTDERERPSEWLRKLRENSVGYAELLRESELVAIAAYRVAHAKCRTCAQPTTVPTAREVHAAAREVVASAGASAPAVPTLSTVVADCEHAGLVVIGPKRPTLSH